MNKYIAIILLAFTGPAYAETYLCIAEAGAGVSYDKGKHTFGSQTYDVSTIKLIQSNNSGEWVAKAFGDEDIWLDCASEFMCRTVPEVPQAYSGYFWRKSENKFVASWSTTRDSGVREAITVWGRCSKI